MKNNNIMDVIHNEWVAKDKWILEILFTSPYPSYS